MEVGEADSGRREAAMDHHIIFGNALDVLRGMDTESVDCVATSPPFFGLRDYGVEGQLGLEATPEEYVERLVGIFAEVRRVLKPGGTVWLNLGDSYAGTGKHRADRPQNMGKQSCYAGGYGHAPDVPAGLKPKDLVGIPWRVGFALQADGWWLRQDIIWAKAVSGEACEHGWHGSCMPESTQDRPTTSHEHIFLLTKSARYWYDYYAAREDGAYPAGTRAAKGSEERLAQEGVNARPAEYAEYDGKRNRRSVWTCSPRGFSGAHFAVWPEALVEPMIVAGCPPKVCANPECGEPWEHRVGKQLVGDRPGRVQARDGDRIEEAHGPDGRDGDRCSLEVRDLGYFPACDCDAKQCPQCGGTGEAHEHYDRVLQATGHLPCEKCDGFGRLWPDGYPDALPGTVLDPFLGSGTTTQVARKLGRRSIGIELNREYEAVMRERLGLPEDGTLFDDEELGIEFVTKRTA